MNSHGYKNSYLPSEEEQKKILENPKKGDIVSIGMSEYRYVGNQQWQEETSGNENWFKRDYLSGPFFWYRKGSFVMPLGESSLPKPYQYNSVAITETENITAILEEPHFGDIIGFGYYEFRYIGNQQWQRFHQGSTQWLHTNKYSKQDSYGKDILVFSHEEVQEQYSLVQKGASIDNKVPKTKDSTEIRSVTKNEVLKNIEKKKETKEEKRKREIRELEEILRKNWEHILNARQMLERGINKKNEIFSQAERKNIEETLAKLLKFRKNTQSKIRRKKKKDIFYPPVPVPPEPVDPIDPVDPEPTPPEPTPPEPIDPKFVVPSTIALKANISEVSQNLEDVARNRASERVKTEYRQSKFLGRIGKFFTRRRREETFYQEELERLKSHGTFDSETRHIREQASDRFGKTNTLFTEAESTIQVNTTHSFSQEEINHLATDFVSGNIDEATFIQELETILTEREELEDLEQKGSNILLSLAGQKAWRDFLKSLPEDQEICKQRIEIHMGILQQRKIMEASLGLVWEKDKEKIIALLLIPEIRNQILQQAIEVDIDVLVGGNAAYDVSDDIKVSGFSYKTGKILQKYPILSSIGLGGVLASTSYLFGPLANTIGGFFGVGSITGARRNAEYTDEHNDFERRITKGNHLKAEIYKTIDQTQADIEGSNGFKKWRLERRLSRAQRKLKLYQTTRKSSGNNSAREGTTHHHFMPTQRLNARLENYILEKSGYELSGENIDSEKRRAFFVAYISQAMARLDMWNHTGHNFLKSRNEQEMEGDMNSLYTNVIYAIEKLGISPEDIRNSDEYARIYEKLGEDITYATGKFNTTRSELSARTFLTHGAIYGGSSLLLQWLAGTGIFDTTSMSASSISVTAGGVSIDPGISHDLLSTLGQSRYDAFLHNIESITDPNTLWETLTRDIFSDPTVGNDAKNQIMTFILNAQDVQNGIVKPELLIEAGREGLFIDISAGSSRIDHVLGLLDTWGYGSVNKTWMLDTIEQINSGALSPTSLTPMEQTKVSEFLWCYVHRNGVAEGSHLWEVFMDRLPDIETVIPGEETVNERFRWLKYGAIPTWRNTFLSALAQEKEENREEEVVTSQDQDNNSLHTQDISNIKAPNRNIGEINNAQELAQHEDFPKAREHFGELLSGDSHTREVRGIYRNAEKIGAENMVKALDTFSEKGGKIGFSSHTTGGYGSLNGYIFSGRKNIQVDANENATEAMFAIARTPELPYKDKEFYHEMGHVITLGYANEVGGHNDLQQQVNTLREEQSFGLTAHAENKEYRDKGTKFWEDMAELMGLYLVGREYAENYLDDRIVHTREQKAQITPELKDEILQVLDNAFDWYTRQ